MPSTYDLVERCFADLRLAAVLVLSYLVYDWLIDSDDDDPDGYA